MDISPGWIYALSGRYTQAKQLNEHILPTAIQLHGDTHPQVAEIYYDLGWICQDLGQPLEAQVWFEKALRIAQSHYGEQHVWTARSPSLV